MPADQYGFRGWTLEKIGAIDGSIGMYAITMCIDGRYKKMEIGKRLYRLPWKELVETPEFLSTFKEVTL